MFSGVKPFDKPTLLASIEKTGCVVTCEGAFNRGRSWIGGCRYHSENHPVPLERRRTRHSSARAASLTRLLAEYGLTPLASPPKHARPSPASNSGQVGHGKMCHGV